MNDLPRRLRTVSGQTCIEAADAPEKQQAEIEELKIQGAKLSEAVYLLSEGNVTLIKERDSLKAQAVKDAADAGRYRWLREYKLAHNGHCQSLIGPILWSKSLDEAVDVAMKESQQ